MFSDNLEIQIWKCLNNATARVDLVVLENEVVVVAKCLNNAVAK
jgi:hypothetical protein